MCYQITDVIEAMKKDAGIHLTKLHVDGKMARNNLLLQLQADISGIPIRKLSYQEHKDFLSLVDFQLAEKMIRPKNSSVKKS